MDSTETKKIIDELINRKQAIDDNNVYYKEKIKERLINNPYIIHVLNNEELEKEDAEADEYLGINILPYYLVTEAQNTAANYICFETMFTEVPRYSDTLKLEQIVFYILCDNKNVLDPETGIARHDLLAALLIEEFNYTNIFGMQIQLISDKPGAIDNNYISRTLIFEQTTTNSLTKNQQIINRLGG